MSYLEISKLNKSYGKQAVLNNISLEVKKGEFVVLLGPSGCGKSTLLNCIAGLLKYESGDISVQASSMNDVHPSQRDIAMVFQSYALYPNMTVKENISFGMKIRKTPKEEIEKKVGEVSKILNITELLDRRPSALSGGQQQRVAIGRALVRDPLIFLFDEPLSNLDAKLREAMRTEIKALHQRLKTTIIYVTHDQVEAMSLADKIAVMDKGKVIQFGKPGEVYSHPNSTFVAEFIGSPPMNLFSCKVVKKGQGFNLTFDNRGKKTSLNLPFNVWPSKKVKLLENYCKENDQLIMGIRPENIQSKKEKGRSISKLQFRFPLKVDLIEPIGADNLIITSFNNNKMVIRHHSDIPLPELKKTVDFFLDMGRALFYSPDDGTLIA